LPWRWTAHGAQGVSHAKTPTTIFIITTKTFDTQASTDHEVQKVLLKLLLKNQMDSFDQESKVKVGPLPHAQLSPRLIASIGDHD